MHMRDANFAEAYNEFYAGFRAYRREAGTPSTRLGLPEVCGTRKSDRVERPRCYREALSDINPFDAREAKAYQEETEVAAMRTFTCVL